MEDPEMYPESFGWECQSNLTVQMLG